MVSAPSRPAVALLDDVGERQHRADGLLRARRPELLLTARADGAVERAQIRDAHAHRMPLGTAKSARVGRTSAFFARAPLGEEVTGGYQAKS